jgi:LuxR family maltose regulon positive regulatory protein
MRGELDRSRPYFDEAAGSTDAALRAYALAELSLIATALGEREEASAKAEAACKLVRDAGIEDLIMAGVAQAAAARSALTTGDTVAARASLSAATRPLDLVGQGLPMDALHAELLLAEVALDLAEYETAKRYIERGAEVTASIRDSGIMDQQLADLRARLEQAPPPTAPGPFESEDWSERELEVLQLLPAELTTREIGEDLFLSRNTIKTYMRRIYAKLGAHSRVEAVRRARDLGLLGDQREET